MCSVTKGPRYGHSTVQSHVFSLCPSLPFCVMFGSITHTQMQGSMNLESLGQCLTCIKCQGTLNLWLSCLRYVYLPQFLGDPLSLPLLALPAKHRTQRCIKVSRIQQTLWAIMTLVSWAEASGGGTKGLASCGVQVRHDADVVVVGPNLISHL